MSDKLSYTEYDVVFKPGKSLSKVYVELTNDCNLTCEMCYRKTWDASTGQISVGLFKQVIDELAKDFSITEFVFGGLGETMLHDSFWELLEYAHRCLPNSNIKLTTNGLLLNSSIITKLAANGVRQVVVSVDGADLETMQKVRGKLSQELHKKLITNGQVINETANIEWHWETVWQKNNRDQLNDIIKFANDCNVKKIIVSHLMPTSAAQCEQALFLPEVSSEDVIIKERARNKALMYGIEIILPRTELNTERLCRFVEHNSTVINYDGRVAPCYRYLHGCSEFDKGSQKKVDAFDFGTVSEDMKLYDIWNSSKYMHFRYRIKNSLYPSCHDCELLEGCDIVAKSEADCDGGIPACGDCLWARGFIQCP